MHNTITLKCKNYVSKALHTYIIVEAKTKNTLIRILSFADEKQLKEFENYSLFLKNKQHIDLAEI